MMESKVEKRIFGISEFKEEEKWLEEQQKNGWRLIKTNRSKYGFEKCNADECVYQIDFMEKGKAEEEYVQMFMDCGWECVLQYSRWCYFRRKKEKGADLSIFSDRSSRIDMYTRMLKNRHLVATVALFVFACVIEWLTIFTKVIHGNGSFLGDFWAAALPWIGAGLFVATFFSVEQYMKLRKMIEELKIPEK